MESFLTVGDWGLYPTEPRAIKSNNVWYLLRKYYARRRRMAKLIIVSLIFIILIIFIGRKSLQSLSGRLVMDSGKYAIADFDVRVLLNEVPEEVIPKIQLLNDDTGSNSEQSGIFSSSDDQDYSTNSQALKLVQFENKLRDTYSVYLSLLKLSLDNGEFNPIVPFSWIDWYDLNIDDHSFVSVDQTLDTYMQDVKESEPAKALRGLSYIASSSYKIRRMIFMDSASDINYVVRVRNQISTNSSVRNWHLGIVHFLQNEGIYSASVDLLYDLEQITEYHNDMDQEFFTLPKLETRSNMDYDSFDGDSLFINLHEFDFQLNLAKRIIEIGNFHTNTAILPEVITHTENIRRILDQNDTEAEKFFHEVELENDQSLAGSHYDWRFFKRVLENKQKYFVLHHLIRTWQEFANKEKIIYWLSHGNLLSWRWSGVSFMWDHDCDIQLPIRHLEYLAANFNGSLIIEDPKSGLNRYLIEVNPYYLDRENSNGKNSIDGRIIDITTGLYIDLTGLSLKNKRADFSSNKFVGDKHIHNYLLQSLSPLRATLYEGKLSWVPHDVDFILTEEYPSGLVDTEYNGYKYLSNLNIWLKNPEECLEQSFSNQKTFHYVSSVSTCDQCNVLSFPQMEHIFQILSLKKIENEIVCFNRTNCILPLSKDESQDLSSSELIPSLVSNIEAWKLSKLSAEGLRRLITSFDIDPIPNTDITVIQNYYA